ncbi:MAG: rod-binding protein [Pseudomonadota bacterium]
MISDARPAGTPGMAYNDITSLQRIGNGEEGLRAAAEQFESMFIGMMLEGMRKANAVFAEGNPLSSPEVNMHQEMLDQQWAVHMAESGGMGLADVIVEQLGGVSHRRLGQRAPAFAGREAFVAEVSPVLEGELAGSGIDPREALEQSGRATGWGARVVHAEDGTSTHNLFGLRDGDDWSGETVEVRTLELRDGRREPATERFRSYPDLASAVRDYARSRGGATGV